MSKFLKYLLNNGRDAMFFYSETKYPNAGEGIQGKVTLGDIKIAKAIGWKNITKTDIGTTIGTNPENGKTEFIPTPSKDWNAVLNVVAHLNEAGYLISLDQYRASGPLNWDVTIISKNDEEWFAFGENLNETFVEAVCSLVRGSKYISKDDTENMETPTEYKCTGSCACKKKKSVFIEVNDSQIIATAIRKISRISQMYLAHSNKERYTFSISVADIADPILFQFDTLDEATKLRGDILDKVQEFFEERGE